MRGLQDIWAEGEMGIQGCGGSVGGCLLCRQADPRGHISEGVLPWSAVVPGSPRTRLLFPSELVCSHDSFPMGSLILLGMTAGVFILLVMTEGLYALAQLQQAGMKILAERWPGAGCIHTGGCVQ